MRRGVLSFLAFSFSLYTAAPAHALELQLPVDCKIGEDCFIQNFADVDPGPEASDYTCGSLSYDGHKGTDFGLRNLSDLARGVIVRAAADGEVRNIRDNMPDRLMTDETRSLVNDRECGNGVVIAHGDGWETQYCHMLQGSISVHPGQRVRAGDRLGRIGLSGATEFPHLHLSVRRHGAVIDPFIGAVGSAECGDNPSPLWSDAALQSLGYQPSGILDSGFIGAVPDYDDVLAGNVPRGPLRASQTESLVFWAHVFGLREGDRVLLRLYGPDGDLVAETEDRLTRNRARQFNFVGKRRPPPGGWPRGNYEGEYILRRIGRRAPVIERRFTLDMR